MSEPHTQPTPQATPNIAAGAEEEISWEDALEDLERQKRLIKEQQKQAVSATPRPQPSGAKPAAEEGHGETPANLKLILDIPLQVTVELGRKRLLVHDLLQLSQGSVIELSKQIGEPFEVLVNHKLIARGEVVVINDKFGVRITDIISPLERVQQL
jgi:flagellar motor switch protein FliN/FliY